MSHPYRENPRPAAKPRVEDWHAALRGPSIRRSLWMGLATLTCSLGYPGVVQLLFDPKGPGRHQASVEVFVAGGLVVTGYFVFGAFVTWAHCFKFGASKMGWHARRDSNPRPVD